MFFQIQFFYFYFYLNHSVARVRKLASYINFNDGPIRTSFQFHHLFWGLILGTIPRNFQTRSPIRQSVLTSTTMKSLHAWNYIVETFITGEKNVKSTITCQCEGQKDNCQCRENGRTRKQPQVLTLALVLALLSAQLNLLEKLPHFVHVRVFCCLDQSTLNSIKFCKSSTSH